MDLYRHGVLLWLMVACRVWTGMVVGGKPVDSDRSAFDGGVIQKVLMKPCTVPDKKEPALQKGSNKPERVIRSPCSRPNADIPSVEVIPEKPPVTVATKQEIITEEVSGADSTSYTESAHMEGPAKEDLSGGRTSLASGEFRRSEVEEEEEEELVDSLAPRPLYPEMDGRQEAPRTTEAPPRQPGQDIAANNNVPNEKKSELFIDSGLFPFIAMGVLTVLFITMMIAALYFARHSSHVHHGQISFLQRHGYAYGYGQESYSMKRVGFGGPQGPYGTTPVNAVAFRNAQDAVIGDFAVNMFAVREDEREEATRELSESTDSTLLTAPTKATQRVSADPPSPPKELERTSWTRLDRDLPDVVSSPSSRRETMSNNRHSTGSSLYMELVNMCRNTRLLEELALRRKNIRMQDASQLEDGSLPDLSDEAECGRSCGKLVLRRQASLDSARYRESIPLPYTYESHYYKVYDGDDDDSLAPATSANTTADTVALSSDDGCAGNLGGLTRKGSSKRGSRPPADESRLLLPVQEFFNETLIVSSDGDEVLYETIDEMGYRRRTASSRAIRQLMAAREIAGHQARETVVVENAWETSLKRYDRIDRSMKAYKKQVKKEQDYNTLVV